MRLDDHAIQEKRTLTTRYAGDTETLRRKYKCGVYFVHASTHGQNKRHGFLEEFVEREELVIDSLLSREMAPENVAGIAGQVIRTCNSRNIRVSSLSQPSVPQAERVVNLFLLYGWM
jgi:hypothetical protein